MSHFTVLVIGDNVDEQLAPFDENLEVEFQEGEDGEEGYYCNPRAKWDWYSIGGRWTGYFKLKAHAEVVVGEPGVFGRKADPGWGDQCRKDDIDIEGMRDDAEAAARKEYAFIADVFGGTIPKLARSWKDFREDETLTWEMRRNQYHDQAPLVAIQDFIREHKGNAGKAEQVEFLTCMDFADYEGKTEEEIVQEARKAALSSYAVLKDGEWHERGEMGWFGISSNEKDKNDWLDEFNQMIDSLPGDTLLTIVDCHI